MIPLLSGSPLDLIALLDGLSRSPGLKEPKARDAERSANGGCCQLEGWRFESYLVSQILLTSKFSPRFWLTLQRDSRVKTGHIAGAGALRHGCIAG
jgi:hypothetical protein